MERLGNLSDSCEELQFASHTLLAALSMAAPLAGCDNKKPGEDKATVEQASEQTASATSDDISWFTRGGSLNRASTLDDWRAADTRERLASAADLLSMKVRDLPAPKEAAQMARALEAKITEAAEAGEKRKLGPIVDRVAAELNW